MLDIHRGLIPTMFIVFMVVILATRWLARPDITVQAAPLPTAKPEKAARTEKKSEEKKKTKKVVTGKQEQADDRDEQQPKKDDPTQENRDEDCPLASAYPDSIRRWCGWIDQYARQYGLDTNLVAAVMLQESGGNPDAYSGSGAVGLMQVMPRDGIAAGFTCANGPCFASRPSMEELFDPEFNLSYGARMLAGLIERRGSVRDGLMAYGPANVGYYYADKVLAIYERYR